MVGIKKIVLVASVFGITSMPLMATSIPCVRLTSIVHSDRSACHFIYMAVMYALVAQGEADRVDGALLPKTKKLLQHSGNKFSGTFKHPYIFDAQTSKRIINQLTEQASIAAQDEKGSLGAVVAEQGLIEEGEIESAKRNAVMSRSNMKMRDETTIRSSLEDK